MLGKNINYRAAFVKNLLTGLQFKTDTVVLLSLIALT